MFTAVGNHFNAILVGCIECAVAIFLLGSILHRSRRKRKYNSEVKGAERIFLKEMQRQTDEVCLVLRLADRKLVYSTGDMDAVLEVSKDRVQSDVTRLLKDRRDEVSGHLLWEQYMEWDGKEPLALDFQKEDASWVRMYVTRNPEASYDVIRFRYCTEIYAQQAEYEARLQRAEDESQAKTTFLSRMSHEIRTPMNGLMGMLSLAESKLQPAHPIMRYLKKMDELSEHLLSLINDILDMSRIEAGKVELEAQPLSLHELGQRLYDMFAKNLARRGIAYEVNYENMDVDWVIGDELRISQIIINFLSNAVKFTKEGEVTVTFRQMMKKDGKVDLMIRVHDTGIGMNHEFITRIFRPFEQESMETAKNYGGSGLGMAITDHLVKMMGGEIVVESQPDVGSDFYVYLSLPIDETSVADKTPVVGDRSDAEPAKADGFVGRQILLAEDNELNAEIAQEILTEMGAYVDLVENGQLAVDAFLQHDAYYYDVILLDVQMPVMDGRTAARTIRSLEKADAKNVLIFAMSADAFVEDERLSMESGMNGHFSKPVDYQALERKIGALLKEREA